MRYRIMGTKQCRYLVNSIMEFLFRLLKEEGKCLVIIIVFSQFLNDSKCHNLSTEMGDTCERQVGEPLLFKGI